jgi:branched-chain amino acid transport system substrate-binding protein
MQRRAPGAVAALVILSACGTRMSAADVDAGVGGRTVEFSSAGLDQLRQALQPGGTADRQANAGSAEPAGSAAEAAGAPAAVAGTGSMTRDSTTARRSAATRPAAADGAKTRAGIGAQAAVAKEGRAATGGKVPPAASAGATPVACAAPGAPLALGQVGNFSGVAGPMYQSARTTLVVWAKDVNGRGGVACHRVVVYAQDDGAESARSAAIVQDLVQNKKVQAMVASFMVLSMPGYRSGIEAMKVPTVGGDVLSKDWTESPYLFPQGAGVDAQILGMLKQPVELLGRKKFGMLYCVETSACGTNEKMFERYSPAAGGTWMYSSPISLTQPDFTAQCQNAKNNGVDVLILGMDGSSMQRVGRSCTAVNYHPHYVTSALIISAAQSQDPVLRQDTMSTVSMNAPWMLEDLPGQRDFRRALRTYAPDMLVDGPAIAAWASAKLFEAAIARLGDAGRTGPITTAMVLDGLGRIRNETLGGLAPPITFSPGQAHAPMVSAVFNEFLDTKGWSAPKGNKAIRLSLDATKATAPAPPARPGPGTADRPRTTSPRLRRRG